MTTEVTIESGSILGLFGDVSLLVSYISAGEEEADLLDLQKTTFPLNSLLQKTVILSEANQAYEGVVSGKFTEFIVIRDNSGDVGFVRISSEQGKFYLPGSVLTIPGSQVGGEDLTDDIKIKVMPDNGMVFDTGNDYAILNGSGDIVDTGFKAQVITPSNNKVGGVFILEPHFSFTFSTES